MRLAWMTTVVFLLVSASVPARTSADHSIFVLDETEDGANWVALTISVAEIESLRVGIHGHGAHTTGRTSVAGGAILDVADNPLYSFVVTRAETAGSSATGFRTKGVSGWVSALSGTEGPGHGAELHLEGAGTLRLVLWAPGDSISTRVWVISEGTATITAQNRGVTDLPYQTSEANSSEQLIASPAGTASPRIRTLRHDVTVDSRLFGFWFDTPPEALAVETWAGPEGERGVGQSDGWIDGWPPGQYSFQRSELRAGQICLNECSPGTVPRGEFFLAGADVVVTPFS